MEKIDQAEKRVPPYSALAYYYDRVMEHVNYYQWANYVKILFKYADRRVRYIADLACGTGSLLRYLGGMRRRVFGLDLSYSMLKAAQGKLYKSPLVCADFTSIPLKPLSFDAVLVLYDSVNYLHEDNAVLQFFDQTYQVLKPGGLLIFDIVTPHLCKTAFKKYYENAMTDDYNGYERFSFYREQDQTQVNQFKIWINGKFYFEEHKQKIREISQWIELIHKTNFKIERVFSNFTLKPAAETSERAHFVLKRK